jgi:uncharacterized phiE125 gp8 family phage protein
MASGLKSAGSPYRLYTAAELRERCRIASGISDGAVNELLDSAVAAVERELARSLLQTEWTLYIDGFPESGEIHLPIAPVISADVEYFDEEAGDYVATSSRLLATYEPARVTPPIGEEWPEPMDVPASVQVIFLAGYGATASNVPADLRRAVLMLASHFHENPQAVVVGSDARTFELPMGVRDLIEPYRWTGFF